MHFPRSHRMAFLCLIGLWLAGCRSKPTLNALFTPANVEKASKQSISQWTRQQVEAILGPGEILPAGDHDIPEGKWVVRNQETGKVIDNIPIQWVRWRKDSADPGGERLIIGFAATPGSDRPVAMQTSHITVQRTSPSSNTE